MSELTYYYFNKAIGGYFECPTDEVRKFIPSHLQPVELRPGVGIFAVILFDFTESSVGAYHEAVTCFIVQPHVRDGEPMPHSAFFPITVATNTENSKDHANERWHLPGWIEVVDIDIQDSGDGFHGTVSDSEGNVIIRLVTKRSAEPSNPDHLYQSFMTENNEHYRVSVTVEGSTIEHEEGDGNLEMSPHPFLKGIDPDEIETEPFREIITENGRQVFESLIDL
ncbi:MAG: hypothetical protein MK080_01155 [Opitutales bacterium]|nr:hypothetical protein [Opitutales bacterium]NRA28286.1 hypothetical protein [Opitutales bacterium]